jgi:hypothetical protein
MAILGQQTIHFGKDISVTFKYVDVIPTLSSGKKKKDLNLYHLN